MPKTTARRRRAKMAGDFRKGLKAIGKETDHQPIPQCRSERAERLAALARSFRTQLLALGIAGPSPEPRSFAVAG